VSSIVYLLKTNLNTNETSREKLYKYPVPDVFSIYKSDWRLKPDGSKMASAMHSINMINILDLRDNGRKSLIVNPPAADIDNIIDIETGTEKRTYYAGIEVTDNYIYALYIDQNYDDTFEVEKEMEVHVFDWEGNPVFKYVIHEYVTCIAVDENGGRLFGLAYLSENIYVYDMK
jgi:hypothetical protein